MTPVCALDAVPPHACREFEFRGEACFLVHLPDGPVAYLNRCPHRGVTLNWRPDDFLTDAADAIRCSTHDAQFRLRDGLCLAGPCRGERLVQLTLRVQEGTVFVCE